MHLIIVCMKIVLIRLWTSFKVKSSVVINHSLKEYAAFTVTDVFSNNVVIFLINTCVLLLNSKCIFYTHDMLFMCTSMINIIEVTDDFSIEIACINNLNKTVVNDSTADLNALSVILTTADHRTFKLKVAYVYHTRQMNALLNKFIEQTQMIICKKLNVLIILSQHVKVLFLLNKINVSYLTAATQEKVNFTDVLNVTWDTDVIFDSIIWLEIDHHSTLYEFISWMLFATHLTCSSLYQDDDNWKIMIKTLCALCNVKMNLDWNAYHYLFKQSLRLVDASTYAWNNKNYWIQYHEKWNLIKEWVKVELKFITIIKDFFTFNIHQLLSEWYNKIMSQMMIKFSIMNFFLQDVINDHVINEYNITSLINHYHHSNILDIVLNSYSFFTSK